MTPRPDRRTADQVANILGLADAKTLLNEAIRPDAISGEALAQIAHLDHETRRGLALMAIAQTLDAIRSDVDTRADQLDKLQTSHDSIMSGESKTGCRHLADAESRLRVDVAVVQTKLGIYAGAVAAVVAAVVSAVSSRLWRQ